jgi:hypothetical protein
MGKFSNSVIHIVKLKNGVQSVITTKTVNEIIDNVDESNDNVNPLTTTEKKCSDLAQIFTTASLDFFNRKLFSHLFFNPIFSFTNEG